MYLQNIPNIPTVKIANTHKLHLRDLLINFFNKFIS